MSRVLRRVHLFTPLCHLITSCVLSCRHPSVQYPRLHVFHQGYQGSFTKLSAHNTGSHLPPPPPKQPRCVPLVLQTSPNQVPQAACVPSRPPRLVHTPCSCARASYGCGQRWVQKLPKKLQPHHPLWQQSWRTQGTDCLASLCKFHPLTYYGHCCDVPGSSNPAAVRDFTWQVLAHGV
jgi:hypothetical protein